MDRQLRLIISVAALALLGAATLISRTPILLHIHAVLTTLLLVAVCVGGIKRYTHPWAVIERDVRDTERAMWKDEKAALRDHIATLEEKVRELSA